MTLRRRDLTDEITADVDTMMSGPITGAADLSVADASVSSDVEVAVSAPGKSSFPPYFLSPMFIDFLAHWRDGVPFGDQIWMDQTKEVLSSNIEIRRKAPQRLERLGLDQRAKDSIERVDFWFLELCGGRSREIEGLRRRFKIIAVVGAPRTGGSYLTAELFAALGRNPVEVPAVIAHDGFPEARPLNYTADFNWWIQSLSTMAEYLVMLELFFLNEGASEVIVIPKKMTKAVYAGGLFNYVLGPATEFILTVRHPIDSCVSTYELSGGFPADGKFAVRSAIERWIRRDITGTMLEPWEFENVDYFSAYIRYWEQFHINLALSGLLRNMRLRVVPFGAESMQDVAREFHGRFGSGSSATPFLDRVDGVSRHRDWLGRAREAISRVSSIWSLVGLSFPEEQFLMRS